MRAFCLETKKNNTYSNPSFSVIGRVLTQAWSFRSLRTFKKFSTLLLAGPSILGASPVTFKDHPPLDVYDTIRNMAFTQMSPYLGASQHILYSHPCITEWKTSLHRCHPWISSWYRRKKYHLPSSCLSIAALQSLLHM